VKRSAAGWLWTTTGLSLVVLGLASGPLRSHGAPAFWSSYVLDITGPAWSYILLRQLYEPRRESELLARVFTPTTTALTVVGICFLVEIGQFMGLYDATPDPWDFVAYASGVTVFYAVDLWSNRRLSRAKRP
jgi:hypothetical protein